MNKNKNKCYVQQSNHRVQTMDTLRWVAFTSSFLLAIKLLLIPTYTSTDFEVHRNWMAVTANLKLKEWYYEKTSEWTLDYPPFFAYFELLLAKIADYIGFGDILAIREKPLFNDRVLYFQRISVIVCDYFYIAVCALICFSNSQIWFSQPKKIVPRAQLSLFVLLASNAGLLLVDNIHFQYNGLLTAFLLLSIHFIERGQFLKGAIAYSILLNFKHIYIYYAPAFVVYYSHQYFDLWNRISIATVFSKGIFLTIALLSPVILSFGPFYYVGGLETVQQILSRLFPVSRGLTHAYWAPNFWALYNFADMILYRLFPIFKLKTRGAPTYSTGLVQEHSHSVLPCITTLHSLTLVLVSLSPLIFLFFKKKRSDFSLFLTLSSLSFFFFGYHVHEKALLLVVIPLIILSFSNPLFLPVCVLMSTITSFTIFPLLFQMFEIPIKYGIAASYLLLMLICIRNAFHVKISYILPMRSILYISGLVGVELYATFGHKIIFSGHLPFIPLLLISVYNSAGVAACYFWIFTLAIHDEVLIPVKKKECELTEELIKISGYPVQWVEAIDEVKIVGGVDISSSKTNSQFAVVSLVLYSFPQLELLATHEEVVIIAEPYITDYLALREAGLIAKVVRRFLDRNPDIRPDVLICDGNGRFHSRGCGVACHIGAKSGVASIGVAKNLNLSLLVALKASKEVIEKAEKLVESASTEENEGYVPFDLIQPVTMNVVRIGGSKVPVFVSAGYGIELDLATEIVMKCARNRICEPIRMADLRSRDKVRELFD